MSASAELPRGSKHDFPRTGHTLGRLVVPPALREAAHTRPTEWAQTPQGYLKPYLRILRGVDLIFVSVAVGLAHLLRFGSESRDLTSVWGQVNYVGVSTALVLGWVLALHLQRAYDGRFVGHGIQEYRQVSCSSPHTFVFWTTWPFVS